MTRICERCLNPDINVLELEVFGRCFPNRRLKTDPLFNDTDKLGTINLYFRNIESAQKGIKVYADGVYLETVFPNNGDTVITFNSDYKSFEFEDMTIKRRNIKFEFIGGIDNISELSFFYIGFFDGIDTSFNRLTNIEKFTIYSSTGRVEKEIYGDDILTQYNDLGISNLKPLLNFTNLTQLRLHSVFKDSSLSRNNLPLWIFNMPSLLSLTYGGDLSNLFTQKEYNNFDKLPLLESLEYFESSHTRLSHLSIPDNWKSNRLKGVKLNGFSGSFKSIDYLINQYTVEQFTYQSENIGDPTNDNEWFSVEPYSVLETLTVLTFNGTGLNDPSKLPKNLERAVKLKYLTFGYPTNNICLLSTTEQVTAWWSSWYPFIVANASMDEYAPDQKFRGITFDFRGGVVDTPIEAPNGYIQGSSNGTPTTLGQQIFVLSNQYDHVNSYTTQL